MARSNRDIEEEDAAFLAQSPDDGDEIGGTMPLQREAKVLTQYAKLRSTK